MAHFDLLHQGVVVRMLILDWILDGDDVSRDDGR